MNENVSEVQQKYIINYRSTELDVDPSWFKGKCDLLYDKFQVVKYLVVSLPYSVQGFCEFVGLFASPQVFDVTPDHYFEVFQLTQRFECNECGVHVIRLLYSTEKFGRATLDLALCALTSPYKRHFNVQALCSLVASFLSAQKGTQPNAVASNPNLGKISIQFVNDIIKQANADETSVILSIFRQCYRYHRDDAFAILPESISSTSPQIAEIVDEVKSEESSDATYYNYQIKEKQFQLNMLSRFYRIEPTADLEVTRSSSPPEGYIPDIFEAIEAEHIKSIVWTLWTHPDSVVLERNGLQPLHAAVLKGNKTIAMYIIAKNAPIDGKTTKPIPNVSEQILMTPLHIAVILGFFDIIKLLIKDGASLSALDNLGNTPLHISCKIGEKNKLITQFLISLKVNLNTRNGADLSPLRLAVLGHNIPLIKLLLAHGANLNEQNSEGTTIIETACQEGDEEMISILLENNAIVGALEGTEPLLLIAYRRKWPISIIEKIMSKTTDINAKGYNYDTIVHIAVRTNYTEGFNILFSNCEHKININEEDIEEKTPLHYAVIQKNIELTKRLIQLGADISLSDYNGKNPLHYAVEAHCVELISVLLQNKTKADATDEHKKTPLHYAVLLNDTPSLVALHSLGANINAGASDDLRGVHEITSLHMAAEKNYIGIFHKLLLLGADQNIVDSKKASILHYAARGNSLSIVEKIANQTNVNCFDIRKQTPMHYAAKANAFKVIPVLFHAGARLNAVDMDGITPLMIAAEMNNVEFINTLYEYGDFGYSTDRNQQTALHYATNGEALEAIKVLCKHKIELNAVDCYEKTPLHIAELKGSEEVFRVLIEFGANLNIKDTKGFTILHHAIIDEKIEFIKIIVESGKISQSVYTSQSLYNVLINAKDKRITEIINIK